MSSIKLSKRSEYQKRFKHIEIQTNLSIKKVINEAKKITDARLINKTINQEVKLRVNLNDKIIEILTKLNLLT